MEKEKNRIRKEINERYERKKRSKTWNIKETEVEFTSTDFDAYCIHPLDLVFVELTGFGTDAVQSWPLGVPIPGISGASQALSIVSDAHQDWAPSSLMDGAGLALAMVPWMYLLWASLSPWNCILQGYPGPCWSGLNRLTLRWCL